MEDTCQVYQTKFKKATTRMEGPMAVSVEAIFNNEGLYRKDLFPFARKRGGGRRQPPSGREPYVSQVSPPSTDKNPFSGLTTRKVVIGGVSSRRPYYSKFTA